MSRVLRLSKDLSLPLDVVTQTVAIVAIKRVGKSFTARKLFEALVKAGLQAVAVDPKGDWWGARYGADGKSAGLSVVILGGEHGDLPLDPHGGEVVARFVVESGISVILDLSLMSGGELAIFMAAFGETLYRLKAHERNRSPMMLFVDEADAVAPQRPQEREARMLGAMQNLVRRGGQRGIGCTMITQRTAVLNKDVLTQAQVLIALRTISKLDRKALDGWIEVHGTDVERATLMESIASLPRGDAWVWSPGWPTDEGIFQRVHVDPIETFDSGATPKPGEKRIEPKGRADVDLEALGEQLRAAVEQKKATDPKLLQARIRELEAQAAKAGAAHPEPEKVAALRARIRDLEARNAELERPRQLLKEADVRRLDTLLDRAEQVAGRFNAGAAAVRATLQQAMRDPAPAAIARQQPAAAPRNPVRETKGGAPEPARRAERRSGNGSDEGPSDYAALLLSTLATRHPLRLTVGQLAALSDRSPKGSGFLRALAEVKRLGWATRDGRHVEPTAEGLAEAERRGFQPGSGGASPDELREAWLRVLPEPENRLLRAMLDAGGPLTKEQLAERADRSPKASGFLRAMATLKRNGIFVAHGNTFEPSPEVTGAGA